MTSNKKEFLTSTQKEMIEYARTHGLNPAPFTDENFSRNFIYDFQLSLLHSALKVAASNYIWKNQNFSEILASLAKTTIIHPEIKNLQYFIWALAYELIVKAFILSETQEISLEAALKEVMNQEDFKYEDNDGVIRDVTLLLQEMTRVLNDLIKISHINLLKKTIKNKKTIKKAKKLAL